VTIETGPRSYAHVIRAVFDSPWAILPEKLNAIAELIMLRASGFAFDVNEIAERTAAAQAKRAAVHSSGGTAVIPIYGTVTHRSTPMADTSGMTSVEAIRGAFRSALADERTRSIVFDVDSPGGTVDGVPELAAEIAAARGQKPMTAVANTMMASAAYWLGSAADEVVVTPSALAGSIGVFMVHQDQSAADAAEGRQYTTISAGKYKAETNPHQPLTDEARGYLQDMADSLYGMFVSDVARFRGATDTAVRNGYGEGRLVLAGDAVKAGLADRVATLEQVIARHSGPQRKGAPADRTAAMARLTDIELEIARRERAEVRNG
jgi:signal peptide peptidase SppA